MITSVNFRTSNGICADGTARPVPGNTANAKDFMHGWLNYQIEQHLWSILILSYTRRQLRTICAKYGVPYVQHSVFRQLKKTVDIMVGAQLPFFSPSPNLPQRPRCGMTLRGNDSCPREGHFRKGPSQPPRAHGDAREPATAEDAVTTAMVQM